MGSPVRLAVVLVLLVGLMVGVFVWLDLAAPSGADPLRASTPGAAVESLPAADLPGASSDGQRAPLELDVAAATSVGNADEDIDEQPDEPQSLLAGWVVDSSGRGVSEAEVLVVSGAQLQIERLRHLAPDIPAMDAWTARTTSDRDGRFEFSVDVPRSSNRSQAGGAVAAMFSETPQIVVRHPGFATAVQPCPPLTEGALDLGSIVVQAGGVVTGRVLDDGGVPLAGATITTTSPAESSGNMLAGLFQSMLGRAADRLNEQTTGADGRFEVTGLVPGSLTLAVLADEHPVLELPGLAVNAGQPTHLGDLVLTAGVALAGYVLDDEGQPVSRAQIQLTGGPSSPSLSFGQAAGAQVLGALRRTTHSEDDGAFRIAGLRPGRYTVEVSKAGYRPRDEPEVDAGSSGVEVVLQRLGDLLVRLVDADGKALDLEAARAEVEAWMVEDDDRKGRADVERTGDVFRVVGAGSDGTELQVTATGFATAIERAAGVAPGSLGEHTVALDAEAFVSGRVVDDRGLAVVGATVVASTEWRAPRRGPTAAAPSS